MTNRMLRTVSLLAAATFALFTADASAATNDSRYHARVDAPAGVTPAITLTGQHDGTAWTLVDQAGAPLGQGTLDRGVAQTLPLPGVSGVSLVTSAPVSAWLGAGVGGASGFFPADSGLRAGSSFALTVPPLGAGDSLIVFAFDAADVVVTAPDGTPIDAASLPENGAWEPSGLAAGDTVQIEATGRISVQVAGVSGFDAVPDRFGNDVGYDFLAATGPLGGVAVLAYEDAVIAGIDLDDDSLVLFETLAKGAVWHMGDLAGRRIWISSNAPVAVWAGDHDGVQDIAHMGDDVALHLGRGGTELRIHTQALGATVFAGTDGTVVKAGAQSIPMAAGASADLAPNQSLLVTANHPVLVETRGGSTLSTWGVALRELPPGVATAFEVLPAATTVEVGAVLPFTVIARDAGGAIDTAYAGSVAFTASDPDAALPETFVFGAEDQGQHTFGAELRFLTAGTQTLTVTDTAAPSKQGAAVVTVTGGALDPSVSLVSAAPDTLDANGTAAAVVTVTARDSYENLLAPGQAVIISTTLGTLEGAVSDLGDGTYTQVLRAPAVAGTASVSATVGGVALEPVATVTFKKDSTPPAPVTASVNGVQETQATVAWTASASPDVAYYEVVPSQGGAVIDAGAATSAIVTGLTGCTSYGFRVIPVDAVGNKGVASNEATFTTVLDGPPPAPTGVTGAAFDTYVVIQWASTKACDHASWSVERSVDGGAFEAVSSGLGSPKIVDAGLTNGIEVRYRVRAHDTTGLAGAPSLEVALTPTVMDPAPPVQGLSATSKAGGGIALSWSPPTEGEALYFTVYRDDVAIGDPASTAFTDNPPAEGSYTYRVSWFDVVDAESQPSAPVIGVSDATAPTAAFELAPAPPVGLGERIVTLTASEALGEAPVVTWKIGTTAMAPLVFSPKPGNPAEWTATLTVPPGAPSGTATLTWAGKDIAGNIGAATTGATTFAVDAAPPSAALTLSRPSPVSAGPLGITLTVSEPLVTPPTLTWAPFLLTGEPVELQGAGLVWTGEIAIIEGPNDGEATLAFSGTDTAGNVGTTITAGGTFVVDTTPPNDPQTLLVLSAPKGAFNLAWGTSSGGGVAKYEVFRSDAPITSLDSLTPVGSVTTNKLSDLPPTTGTWHYAVRAVDAAGNASGFITGSGTSDQEPPGPPSGLAATVGGGQVSLAWVAPASGATTYRVYRSLTSYGGSVVGKAPLASGVAAPLATDTPVSDADYYYVITALDAYQNESGPSNEVLVHFDEASPVITVSGVEPGKHYKAPVSPAWVASDFTLQSSTGTLDGQPFVSGAAVASEGPHELIVTAKDESGHTATKKVSFVLDLTAPVVTVSGVAEGALYETAPSATVAATDAYLASKTVTLDGKTYSEGSPITGHGNHTLVATATDKAGNKTTVTMTFEVDLPPGPVPSLEVVVTQDDAVTVTWAASTESDIVGYRLTRNGALVTEGAALSASAGLPPTGSERAQIQVVAIDARGHVGAPRAATAYPLRLALVQAGAVLDDGSTALTRDTFDRIQLQAQSEDPQPLTVGPLGFTVNDDQDVDWFAHEGTETWAVDALGATLIEGSVLTHVELTDAATLDATLRQPAPAGSTVRLVARFPVAVRWSPGPLLEVLPKQLLRGFEGEIAAEVHNHGTARMDIVAAKGGGYTDDVIVTVRTPEGVILDQAKTVNITGATWVGQDAVAQITPAGQFTFGPATIVIPVDAPDAVVVEARVVKTWHGYGATGAFEGPELVASALVSVVPPPYEVSALPDKAAYKAGETVIVSGVATSTADSSPVPDAVVKLVVSRKGFKQTLYAKTDAQGVYAVPFLPTPGMAGIFAVAAAHPGVVNPAIDNSFSVHGLLLGPAAFNVSLLAGTGYQATFTLENKGETPITGLSAVVPDPVADDGVAPTISKPPPVTLAPGAKATIVVGLAADVTALAGKRSFTVSLSSAEENVRTAALSVDVSVPPVAEPKEWPPVLYVNPQWLDLALVSGKSLVKSVTVTNKGNGAWKGVTLGLPTTPWIKVTTPIALGDVAPGESRTIDVLFLPPPTQPTGVVLDTVWMLSANHTDIPLNMTLKVTSGNTGQVLAKVTNYVYALTAPDTAVPGATVTLQSQAVVSLKLTGTTGADGTVLFENVPAGPYKYIVQAAGFQTVDSASLGTEAGTVSVDGGALALVEVALVESFVDVGWSVTPTTVTDEYDIQVETTFETKVPVPVLNVVPAQQQFSIFPGSSQTGQLEIVNIGLVSAWNVAIGFQQSSYLDLQMAATVIPEIKAQSSVIVPFTIALKTHGSPPPEPCTDYSLTGDVTYLWYCDTAGNWVKMPVLPFGISVKSNAAKVSMSPNVVTRSTYYNCPGFTNGESVVPPNVSITNGDSSPVTICDCGRMTTAGIGLPTLSSLIDKLLGDAKKKLNDLVGKALGELGVPSWEDITEAMGEEVYGDDWPAVKDAKAKLDALADQAQQAMDLINTALDATCEDQSLADNIGSALTALANEAADQVLNQVLNKYTGGALSFTKAYTKFDKLCVGAGGSSSAEVPKQSHSFGMGTMSASVAKGCGPDKGSCCPVSVGYVDYTVICLPGGGSSSQSGGAGGCCGGGGWGGWAGSGSSSSGYCTK